MTTKAAKYAKRVTDGKAGWKQPSVIVSICSGIVSALALATTWYTLISDKHSSARQLLDIQSSLRILAAGQGSSMQSAVEKALEAHIQLPQGQIKQAQSTARLLAQVSPGNEQTWQTVATLANYRSLALSKVPFVDPTRPECNLSLEQQNPGSDIPLELFTAILAENPKLNVVSSCTVMLDSLQVPSTGSIFFVGSTIIYHGGELPPGRKLIFFNCIFKFEPRRFPPSTGQSLLVAALGAELGHPLKVQT